MSKIAAWARPAEFTLGLVFVLAALLKASDINLFAIQIYGYGLIPEDGKWLLGPLAVFAVGAEMFLGAALMLGLRLAMVTLLAAQAMIVVLSGFIVYGWVFHDLSDCGCFGGFIKMGPVSTLLKNVVLLAIGGVAWIGLLQRGLGSYAPRQAGLKAGVSLFATAIALGWSVAKLDSVAPEALPAVAETEASAEGAPPPAAPRGPYAAFTVESEYGTFHLGEGEHLVALLSMTCDHCMEVVPELNAFVYMPELPPLVALGLEQNPGEQELFENITFPEFPIHSLGDRPMLFFSLIGREPPRLVYVVDGMSALHWDGNPPDPVTLLDAIEAHRAGAGAAAIPGPEDGAAQRVD